MSFAWWAKLARKYQIDGNFRLFSAKIQKLLIESSGSREIFILNTGY
jgi:hypothetical protein